MNLAPGTVVDNRYEILSAVGAGGFGTVYRARQLQLDRIVAIKVINLGVAKEGDSLARFEREAKSISAIKHRNIVSIYSYGVWQGAPYMVLELLEGISLGVQLANGQRLSVPRSLSIVKQICQGLASAHANGIIHRDLKTSNVLTIREESLETVKIIDFGLVKIMSGSGIESQRLTEAGLAVGSCQYMSPEQCTASEIDHRSDIYAAGCILYHCLTGRLPFEGDSGVAVMFQHLNSPPKAVASINNQLSDLPDLQRVIDKALAKNPDERYSSALEMHQDLDAIELAPHHLRTSSKLLDVKPIAIKMPKRNSLMVAAIAASVLLASATAIYIFSDRRSQSPASFKSSNDLFVSVVDFTDFNAAQQGEIAEQALKQNEKDHLLNASQLFDSHLIAAGGDTATGKYESALRHVESARPLAEEAKKFHHHTPQWALPLRFAEALWGLNRRNEAIAVLQEAYKRQVQEPESFGREKITLHLVSFLDANDQFEEIYPIYRAEISRGGNHLLQQTGALRRIGDIFCAHGNLNDAETCYKRIGQLRAGAPPALPLVRLAIARGDWNKAHQYWDRHIRSGMPNSPSTQLLAAAFYLHDNQLPEAKKAIKKASDMLIQKSDWEDMMIPWDGEVAASMLDSHGQREDASSLRKITTSSIKAAASQNH